MSRTGIRTLKVENDETIRRSDDTEHEQLNLEKATEVAELKQKVFHVARLREESSRSPLPSEPNNFGMNFPINLTSGFGNAGGGVTLLPVYGFAILSPPKGNSLPTTVATTTSPDHKGTLAALLQKIFHPTRASTAKPAKTGAGAGASDTTAPSVAAYPTMFAPLVICPTVPPTEDKQAPIRLTPSAPPREKASDGPTNTSALRRRDVYPIEPNPELLSYLRKDKMPEILYKLTLYREEKDRDVVHERTMRPCFLRGKDLNNILGYLYPKQFRPQRSEKDENKYIGTVLREEQCNNAIMSPGNVITPANINPILTYPRITSLDKFKLGGTKKSHLKCDEIIDSFTKKTSTQSPVNFESPTSAFPIPSSPPTTIGIQHSENIFNGSTTELASDTTTATTALPLTVDALTTEPTIYTSQISSTLDSNALNLSKPVVGAAGTFTDRTGDETGPQTLVPGTLTPVPIPSVQPVENTTDCRNFDTTPTLTAAGNIGRSNYATIPPETGESKSADDRPQSGRKYLKLSLSIPLDYISCKNFTKENNTVYRQFVNIPINLTFGFDNVVVPSVESKSIVTTIKNSRTAPGQLSTSAVIDDVNVNQLQNSKENQATKVLNNFIKASDNNTEIKNVSNNANNVQYSNYREISMSPMLKSVTGPDPAGAMQQIQNGILNVNPRNADSDYFVEPGFLAADHPRIVTPLGYYRPQQETPDSSNDVEPYKGNDITGYWSRDDKRNEWRVPDYYYAQPLKSRIGEYVAGNGRGDWKQPVEDPAFGRDYLNRGLGLIDGTKLRGKKPSNVDGALFTGSCLCAFEKTALFSLVFPFDEDTSVLL
ncbi:hypothetical protein AAG570_009375 [Ranatra chinensis]|uniref:Uncharacterized protein n=1 Tax=Ranatra chinensis TaxID=642074 RepID=A0ABD0YNW7_9HEMI